MVDNDNNNRIVFYFILLMINPVQNLLPITITSLQVDSLKKGFDGFDKEGGIINQTSMVMILKSMGVDVTKVQCWSKQKSSLSLYVYCNCSLTWRTTQLRWTRRTPANSTSPCFVRLWIYSTCLQSRPVSPNNMCYSVSCVALLKQNDRMT